MPCGKIYHKWAMGINSIFMNLINPAWIRVIWVIRVPRKKQIDVLIIFLNMNQGSTLKSIARTREQRSEFSQSLEFHLTSLTLSTSGRCPMGGGVCNNGSTAISFPFFIVNVITLITRFCYAGQGNQYNQFNLLIFNLFTWLYRLCNSDRVQLPSGWVRAWLAKVCESLRSPLDLQMKKISD